MLPRNIYKVLLLTIFPVTVIASPISPARASLIGNKLHFGGDSMDMSNWEQKNLLSEELVHGLKAAKQLQAELGTAPSLSSSSLCLTTEMRETLLHQIVSSYEKAIWMLNGSNIVHSPTAEMVNLAADPVANTGKVPESPTSINGSPRSEEFLDGGSKDYNLSSKKRYKFEPQHNIERK